MVANPFVLIDPKEWFTGNYGLLTQFATQDPRKVADYDIERLVDYFNDGMGGFLPVVILLSSVPVALWKGDVPQRVLGTAAASFLIVIVCWGYVESHHLLPVLPLLAILTGARVQAVADSRSSTPAGRWLPWIVALVILAMPLCRVLVFIRNATLPNTVAQAKAWIEAKVPPGSRLLIDWAYVPSLHPSAEALRAELEDARPDSPARVAYVQRMLRLDLKPAYRLEVLSSRLRTPQAPSEAGHFDLERYRREGFRFAVISDRWYGRFFRGAPRPEDDPVRAFYTTLLRDCPVLAEFAPEPGLSTGPAIRVIDLRK